MKNGKKSGAKVARKPLKLGVTKVSMERRLVPTIAVVQDVNSRVKCIGG